jgi:chemotaxis protein MotA
MKLESAKRAQVHMKGSGPLGTFIGFALGIAAIALSFLLSAGSVDAAFSFFDPPAMAMVFGGVLASAFGAYRPKDLLKALKASTRAFRRRVFSPKDAAEAALASGEAWKLGPSEMDSNLEKLSDPFLKEAIAMALDLKADTLERALASNLASVELERRKDVSVWEHLASSADAWGSIGALAGFACALVNFEDPVLLRTGLYTALSSALWGLGASLLVFWPVACRLKAADDAENMSMRLFADAIVAIQAGESQTHVADWLEGRMKDLS